VEQINAWSEGRCHAPYLKTGFLSTSGCVISM